MAKAQVTVRLDTGQLARARKALGVRTATQAIEQALVLATEKATHDKILCRYRGVGRKDSFAER
jgi:Arc/MetJ family transcription regulator